MVAGSHTLHFHSIWFNSFFFLVYRIAYLCYNCPISLPTLLRLWDLNFAILMGKKWYFIVVLVCISIIANEFEPLFLKKNISWLLMFPLLRNTYSRFYSIFIRLSIFFLLICRDLLYSLELGFCGCMCYKCLYRLYPLSPAFQEEVNKTKLQQIPSKWKQPYSLAYFSKLLLGAEPLNIS